MGARPPARDRDGRAAASAPTPTSRRSRAARSAASRSARSSSSGRTSALGRADQPPRRRVGGVARTAPRGVSRDGRRRHARPLLPRQRRRLDPRARPRRGHPLEGQLLELARAEGGPARARREGGDGQAPHAPARARVDQDVAARPPCEEPRPHRAVRGASRRQRAGGSRRDAGALHPAGPAPGRRRRARRGRAQVLRRPAAHGGSPSICRAAASSGSSGPTAPARRRSSR